MNPPGAFKPIQPASSSSSNSNKSREVPPSEGGRPLLARRPSSEQHAPPSYQSIAPTPAPSAEMIERRKNEIVNEMLVKIRPFVGPNGSLLPDADFDRFGKLMESEHEFLGRTLLLTILLSSTAEPGKGGDEAKAIVFLLCDRLTKSEVLLTALHKWLSDSVKSGEPICHLSLKILELLSRIHLTVDQLVHHKYGKLVKKLLGLETASPETQRKAQQLYDKWSDLAKSEDTRRRSSTESRSSTLAASEPGAVENLDMFSDANAPKTRAAMILERAAKGQSAPKPTPATVRPMSADDIHKAKKRRQYLQEAVASGQAAPEELELLGILPDKTPTPPPVNTEPIEVHQDVYEVSPRSGRPKKRVSFANEEELVKVHMFQPYEEELPSRSSLAKFRSKAKADYHHADKQEASYAFQQLALEMEPEIEWRRPLDILVKDENSVPARGEESTEKETQAQRERQTVSAVYFSVDHVPPTPSESDPGLQRESSEYQRPAHIPDSNGKVQVQRIVIPDPNAPAKVDPSVLSAFFNTGLLNMPRQGVVSPPPVMPPLPVGIPQLPPNPLANPLGMMGFPGMPMMARPQMPPMPFPLPPSAYGNIFPPPPFPGIPTSRPPFPFPLPGGVRPPMATPPMFPPPPFPGLHHATPQNRPALFDKSSNPKLQTKPCKFYKPGQPGSCRFASSCLFLHQD